jgi:hypothetical protein
MTTHPYPPICSCGALNSFKKIYRSPPVFFNSHGFSSAPHRCPVSAATVTYPAQASHHNGRRLHQRLPPRAPVPHKHNSAPYSSASTPFGTDLPTTRPCPNPASGMHYLLTHHALVLHKPCRHPTRAGQGSAPTMQSACEWKINAPSLSDIPARLTAHCLHPQCSTFDVRRSTFNVRRSMFNVRCSTFNVQCSMFDVRCSMFIPFFP